MNSVAHDRYASLEVGLHATRTRTVTDTDVVLFATVTGDTNPVHLDDDFAGASRFGRRIAHGMLSGGFISAIIAAELPGPGSIYLSQSLRFLRPVFIGDTVTTRVEIVELIEGKRRIRLATTVRNDRDELVVDGEAVILLPKEA
jgi:3-hydroxybutyryl-CoA dehydratase